MCDGAAAEPKAIRRARAQVVALRRGGADIKAEAAMECVFGYGVGVDFTRRDMQARALAWRQGGAALTWQSAG